MHCSKRWKRPAQSSCLSFCPHQTGQLGEAVRDVARLVSDLLDREGGDGEAVEVELHRAKEDLDRTKRQLEERSDELKRRSDQVMELTSKVGDTPANDNLIFLIDSFIHNFFPDLSAAVHSRSGASWSSRRKG